MEFQKVELKVAVRDYMKVELSVGPKE